MKVVVVGAVAAGPKTASKIIRLRPDTEVTVLDKGQFISFAGCGLPYYLSDVVTDRKELFSTPIGVPRDPAFFDKVKGVRVLTRTEALRIDRKSRQVEAKNLQTGESLSLPYDKLVLATGAKPIIPPIPGIDHKKVFTLHSIEDCEAIRSVLANGSKKAVIIGGGLIGVETAEALVQKNSSVTIVEMLPQILPVLDWEMAKLVELHIRSQGVDVRTETRALEIAGTGDEIRCVRTNNGEIPAEFVILCVGVRPNVSLAKEAGLEIGGTGAIRVNRRMQTSDLDIYAVGDCAESRNLVTGQPCYVPLGSTANKQGRVAALNIAGLEDMFPGVLGSTVCRAFDFTVARTGLSETQARDAGYDVVTCLVPGPDRAHYMPTAKLLMLKLVVDRATGRLLGAQATGPGEAAKRIDVAATAITAGMTVDQVSKLDLSYAPPYAPAMDNLITASDVIRNKISGTMVGITPMELRNKPAYSYFFLDVRSPGEVAKVALPGAVNIPLGMLRDRVNEIPRDKEIVAFCQASTRAYEAALILRANGFDRVKVLDGGVAMWPYEKIGGKR
ncbi:MAG TPA: FAD-dependent oxidoreductase [bacterium]|mgnify:CR=1 FL=1|nr:FAD-dependent oxidoreductase [bacterium]HQL62475.1 FAD-dependent oxidoreductase [bacterium]